MDERNKDWPPEAAKHFDQACAYREANDFTNALRECELTIRLAPDLAEAHNLRGALLEELNRREEAIAAYRKALRLDPNAQDARKNLSEAETAVKLIEKTIEHHLERAYAHEEKRELGKALQECDQVIQLAPDLAEAHNLRGIVLDELGYKSEAMAAYREALRLDPSFEDAKENLVELEEELQITSPAAPVETEDKPTNTETAPFSTRTRASWADSSLLSIDTPENVTFDYNVAGIGSRFLAALVDTLIILILQVIVIAIMISLIGLQFGTWTLDNSLLVWLFAALGLVAFAFLWGYYVFFEMVWNGQSIGKRWVGLRVIRTDGMPVTFTESLIRNLVRLVDFLPAYYGVGVITMFIDAQSRRLGDLAAGTVVVHDRESVTLESLRSKPEPIRRDLMTGLAATVNADLPVEQLTIHDVQMAEEFLNRRYGLSHAASIAVAKRISQALLNKMGVPADTVSGVSPQDLILAIVLRYHNKEET